MGRSFFCRCNWFSLILHSSTRIEPETAKQALSADDRTTLFALRSPAIGLQAAAAAAGFRSHPPPHLFPQGHARQGTLSKNPPLIRALVSFRSRYSIWKELVRG
jgi:hypothetical protein